MLTLDQIRIHGESDIQKALALLDRRQRARLLAALKEYDHPRDIPQEFWDEIQREQEEQLATAILLLLLAGDEWTTLELGQQGVRTSAANPTSYALQAARQAQRSAANVVDTLRARITRRIEDALASPIGGVGNLRATAARQAVDDVLTPARREAIATTETTGALTTGQRQAALRAAGDGAALTVDGHNVRIEMRWRTESDNRVCPRCSPLEGQPEEVWSKVFPDGPGVEAHPNCRCWLEPVVVVNDEYGFSQQL